MKALALLCALLMAPSQQLAGQARPPGEKRATNPRASVSGVYSLRQSWIGSGANGGRYQIGVLIADEHVGWLVLGWTENDKRVGAATVYGTETFRTNSTGDVVLSAGNVTYDGYQKSDSGFYVTGVVKSTAGNRYDLQMSSSPYSFPLSAPSGLYDVSVKTAGYAGNTYDRDVSWTGSLAIAVASDTLYMSLDLLNDAGGEARASGRSAMGDDGSFSISAVDAQGLQDELRGTLRAGLLVATWRDNRQNYRYEGTLRGTRK
jgi:hypothetical protein